MPQNQQTNGPKVDKLYQGCIEGAYPALLLQFDYKSQVSESYSWVGLVGLREFNLQHEDGAITTQKSFEILK